MSDPDSIRRGLRAAAERRLKAGIDHDVATEELKEFLAAAKQHPKVSFTEAAKLGGLSREGAYKMLKE